MSVELRELAELIRKGEGASSVYEVALKVEQDLLDRALDEIDNLKRGKEYLEREVAGLIDKMKCHQTIYAHLGQIIQQKEKEAENALFPPVKIGYTVYAALTYDDEEDVIEEYTVGGVGYIDGEWLVYCKKDRDWYKFGTELCKPTREEAEAAIAAARSATDIKDGHKGGAK